MGLDQLADALYSNKPPLSIVDVSKVKSCGSEMTHRGGALMAAYVSSWLDIVPGVDFDRKIPRRVNGYKLNANPFGGVDVIEEGQRVAEFEALVYFQGHPALVEVKSSRLNGYAGRLPKHLEIANKIYGREDVNALLFIHYSAVEPPLRRILEEKFAPNLQIIHTGFSRREINAYLTRNESQFGIAVSSKASKKSSSPRSRSPKGRFSSRSRRKSQR